MEIELEKQIVEGLKDDEIRFLRIMQTECWRSGTTDQRLMPRKLIERESAWLNEKRAHYLLDKWTGKGWYDYGTVIDGGWMTEKGMSVEVDVILEIKSEE